jgi:hypothetical protein
LEDVELRRDDGKWKLWEFIYVTRPLVFRFALAIPQTSLF